VFFNKTPDIHPSLTSLSESFNDHELNTLGRFGTVVNITAGSILAREGAVGTEAVVIISGTANVVRNDEVIAAVGSSTILGEGSLVTGEARNASLVADSDLTVCVLDRRGFHSWLAACPRVEAEVNKLALTRAG